MQATPRRIISSGLPVSTRWPPTSTLAAARRVAPASIFISVDLPAPFEPTSARTSPGFTLEIGVRSAVCGRRSWSAAVRAASAAAHAGSAGRAEPARRRTSSSRS